MFEGVNRMRRAGWFAVAILTACYAVSIADRLVVGLLVDPIRADLSMSDFEMSLILGPGFAIAYALLSLPLGRLADLANRRNLIAASMVSWSACTVACGLASSFGALLVARVGVGVGEAGLSPAAYSILSDRFDSRRLGRAMGTYLMGGVVGNGTVFIAGGALYAAFAANAGLSLPIVGLLAPWQLTLLVLGGCGLLVALVVRLALWEPERRATQRPDVRVVASEAMRPAFLWLFASYAAMSVVVYGNISWLPAYLARTFFLSIADVGRYIGLIVLIGGFAGPLAAGWLADSWRAHRVSSPMRLAAILSVALAGGALLTFQADTLILALVGCLVMSLVVSGMLVLVPLTIQLLSGAEMRGHMTGIALMIGNVVGQTLGPTSVAVLSSTELLGLPMGTAMAVVFGGAALVCSLAALFAYRASPVADAVAVG